jgi:hypothetical protein
VIKRFLSWIDALEADGDRLSRKPLIYAAGISAVDAFYDVTVVLANVEGLTIEGAERRWRKLELADVVSIQPYDATEGHAEAVAKSDVIVFSDAWFHMEPDHRKHRAVGSTIPSNSNQRGDLT